jgi:hypothetical protein
MGISNARLIFLIFSGTALWWLASWGWIANFAPAARKSLKEWVLLALIPLAGAAAYWPFAHNGILGAGDSYHYSLQVADAVTQARAGHWPILVGQSPYAFNGNIHTVRTAPYFTHFAIALDWLSGGQLHFWQLTNLAILLSAALASWIAYVSARWIAPGARLACAFLALLFITAPAAAVSVMAFDMVATFMAVPWLPLIWAAMIQSLRGKGARSWLLLGGALGLAWLAHPPIAIWLTPFAALAGWVGVVRFPLRKNLWGAVGGGAVAAALAGYVFYSVWTLHVPGVMLVQPEVGSTALNNMVSAWPLSLHPVDFSPGGLGNWQLGYALWCLLALSLLVLCRTRDFSGWFAGGCLIALFCFVAPLPGLTAWLWQHLPNSVAEVENAWPMQRLYPVLAAGTIMLAALTWGIAPRVLRPLYGTTLALLVLGLVWSARELNKFHVHAQILQQSLSGTEQQFDLRNLKLTRSSYALFETIPPYFSHSWMDPEFETRLLDANQTLIASNTRAVQAAGTPAKSFSFNLGSPTEFDLAKDEDVLLSFSFPPQLKSGEVTLVGDGIRRIFTLPSSGDVFSFGSGELNRHTLRLRPGRSGHFSLVLNAPAGTTVQGLKFNSVALPIKLTSLTPFRAHLDANRPGWLETPIVFIPGYTARVNGQPVEPRRSGDSLLIVPVGADPSNIEVDYPGPPGLRVLGWLATVATIGFLGVLLSGPGARQSAQTVDISPENRTQPLREQTIPRAWIILTTLAILAAFGVFIFQLHKLPPPSGKLRLVVQFPRWPGAAAEPLIVTGHTGAADALYAMYEDNQVKIGLDHWGAGGPVSAPLPLHPGVAYAIEYESPALLRDGIDRNNGTVRVKIDGKVLLDQVWPTHGAKADELEIGKNLIGVNVCSPFFGGVIQVQPERK